MRASSVRTICVAAFLFTTPFAAAEEIAIQVAPNVLNLGSSGKVVTVHTEVRYVDVDVSSVYLNGVAIDSWKADARGDFVAKFLMDEIKTLDGLVIDGYNTLTLVGLRIDDTEFWGQAEIMVIDEGPGGGRPAEPRHPSPNAGS